MAGSVSRPCLSPVHHGLNLGLTITDRNVQRRAKSHLFLPSDSPISLAWVCLSALWFRSLFWSSTCFRGRDDGTVSLPMSIATHSCCLWPCLYEWLRMYVFSVRINHAGAWPPPLFALGESELQEVRLNTLGFAFRRSCPVNPGIVLIMHLMFVE
jgi:hypothetical protein